MRGVADGGQMALDGRPSIYFEMRATFEPGYFSSTILHGNDKSELTQGTCPFL